MSAAIPAGADCLAPRFMKIVSRRQETADTFTWELDPGEGGFAFGPGQFNMLYLPGAGEVAISISGSPDHPEVLVHTIRAVGRITTALSKLGPGATIGVRGPFGTAWPVEQAEGKHLILVAGGIGLAPLRPVVDHVLARLGKYRKLSLLVGSRTPEDMLYPAEALAWETLQGVDVRVTVDRAGPSWMGRVGVVTTLFEQLDFDPQHTMAMLCGPEVMMRFAARGLIQKGLPPGQIEVSMERNMHCAVGTCGHCQLGPVFVCRDGPVFPWPRIEPLMRTREL